MQITQLLQPKKERKSLVRWVKDTSYHLKELEVAKKSTKGKWKAIL